MHTDRQAQASLERLGGAQSLRDPFLAACQLHPLFLGLRQRGCFFKEWFIPLQTEWPSASRALDVPQNPPCPGCWLPCPPRWHPPSPPGQSFPARAAQGRCAVSPMKARKMDGSPQATCCVGRQSPGLCSGPERRVPREKAGGASGEVMGWVLDASQGAQDVPSRNSESFWVGSLSTASLSAMGPLPCGGRKPSVFTQVPLCEASRLVPLAPCPPLPSILPCPPPRRPHLQPRCSPLLPLRSLSPDGRGGEGHVLMQT